MDWSFRIGRIAGIDIKLHVTFALILGLGAMQWGAPHGARGAAFGVLLVSLLFVCVVLHELGHALVARRFGISTHAILLLPIGGVAQLARQPEHPRHELWIAVAGPVVNLLLAGALLVATVPLGLAGLPEESVRALLSQPSPAGLVLWLLGANVMMALFNLLPALPMDGGRILRAALSLRLGAARATPLAATVGQGVAIGLGVLGLMSANFVLVLIAGFIFLGAGQERSHAQAQQVLSRLRVGEAYNRHALTLSPGDRVARVAEYMLITPQSDFAVVLGGQLQGVVTRGRALEALRQEPQEAYIAGVMERGVPRIGEEASLEAARQRMSELGAPVLAVYRGEEFLGLLGLADLSEAVRVASAMARPPSASGGVRQAA